MKLLITSNSEQEPIFWKYDNEKLVKILFKNFDDHDMLLRTRCDVDLPTLPLEIINQIIKEVVLIRLQTINLDQVFELCVVSKNTCKVVYEQIYGLTEIKHTEMIRRIGVTLEIVEYIYDYFITRENPDELNKVAIRLFKMVHNSAVLFPWDFHPQGRLESIDTDGTEIPDIISITGACYGDTVWIHGTNDDGMIEYDMIEQPVITLILSQINDQLIPREISLIRNNAFIKFSQLLRTVFGGNKTGVYYMVRVPSNENPFITFSDTLIQI